MKPKEIEMELFRNDDKKEFQVQLVIRSYVYTVESYKEAAKARKRYQYLLEQLKTGAKIQQKGRRFTIAEDYRT